MKHSKIISAILAAAIIGTSMTAVASAKELNSADLSIVAPCYAIANNPVSQLSVSGTTAYCSSQVSGLSVKSITAEQSLEKFWGLWVWNEVDYWSESVNTTSIFMSNHKYNLESGTYRLKTVFTLTATNGKTETITVYSEEVTI